MEQNSTCKRERESEYLSNQNYINKYHTYRFFKYFLHFIVRRIKNRNLSCLSEFIRSNIAGIYIECIIKLIFTGDNNQQRAIYFWSDVNVIHLSIQRKHEISLCFLRNFVVSVHSRWWSLHFADNARVDKRSVANVPEIKYTDMFDIPKKIISQKWVIPTIICIVINKMTWQSLSQFSLCYTKAACHGETEGLFRQNLTSVRRGLIVF